MKTASPALYGSTSLAGLLCALAFASAATAQPISAQADPQTEEAPGGLTEIVVTARRISENLQVVPVAVTAFSGEQLRAQAATRVEDIARTTPALTIRSSGPSTAAPVFQIRGQIQTDILATLDPSVGVYVDGYYIARAYGVNADLLDLQSAQVLKGPQGTLFGRNTTGGAILLQTNDPTFDGIKGQVSATYGRFNERRGSAVINLPLIDDRLALRAAYAINKRDGYIKDSISGRKLGQLDSWTGRVKLLFQATDNLSFLAAAEKFKTDPYSNPLRTAYVLPTSVGAIEAAREVNGPTGTPAQGLALLEAYRKTTQSGDTIALNNPSRAQADADTYTGTINLDTFFGAIKFIGGYRKVSASSPVDLDGSPYDIISTLGTQDLSQYSGDVQITGKAFDDAVDFAGGVFYFHESGSDTSTNTPLRLVTGVATSQNIFSGNIDNDSQGIYGQSTYHITEALSFTGGLRYSVEDKAIVTNNRTIRLATGVVTCSIAGAVAPDCPARRKNAYSGVSYTAGLDYKFTPDILGYIKTGKGFRSGGQNLRSAGTLSGFTAFQPEIARSHEFGVKSQFLDRRVRLNIAGYLTNVSNIQRTTIVSFPPPSPVATATLVGNAGKARIHGGEVEFNAVLFEGFELGATGAYTKAKYVRYVDPNSGVDRSHERFDGVPEWTFSVSGTYTHEFDVGKMTLRADYAWQDDTALDGFNYYTDAAGIVRDAKLGTVIDPTIARNIKNALTQKAVGLLNARAAISVMDNKLELAVFGRNILDNRGRISAVYLPAPLGIVGAQTRDPATYGGSLTYKFGA